MSERKSLLKTIQELGFTLIDNGLYLDAYESDEAFEYSRKIYCMYKKAVEEYTEKYGPLTANSTLDKDSWEWTKTPWPWELEANI